ncbi:MAG: argininosuccinate synthase [Nitrososphaerales archaeon]
MNEKVVLAYSGGLDTSVAVKWLQVKYGFDVMTVTVDVGQGDDFKDIEQKSKALGAIKHFYFDAKQEFAKGYVIPSIKANGLYEGKYPLATALARPLIAAKTVEVAKKESARALAHGCTGKGNDQVRFDITLKSLLPELKIVAPIRDMNLTRDAELEIAKEYDIPISSQAKKYSIDQNLWGRAVEGGVIENADSEPPEDAFQWVKTQKMPDTAGYMDLELDNGIPVGIDGKLMNIVDLVQYANEKAGSYGVGIIDHIEDRVVGIKSREVYEAPGATCIIEAHKDLEKLTLTKHQIRFKQVVDEQWAWLTYSGLWLDPLKTDLDKFIDATQVRVCGKVKLKMYKGSHRIVGRKSKYSLYEPNLATYSAGSTFDQSLARGFVELWGLQSVIANEVIGKSEE